MTPSCEATTAFSSGVISRCAEPARGAGPAHVAISAACSMRKSTGCMRERHTVDANALLPGSIAGDDGDRTLREAERIGEDLDQLGVGGAFHRRRVQTNEDRIIPHAGDTCLAGPRYDADVDDHSLSRRFKHRSRTTGD